MFAIGVVFLIVFFFFQAEDGIRDWSVTGVQTCALPILQTVANQFLTMESLEHGVANSCISVSKYGTVVTWGCKQIGRASCRERV